MRHDAAEVDQHPSAVGVSLQPGPQPGLLRPQDDAVCESARLDHGASRDEHEGVGDDGTAGQIEDDDVLPFPFLRGVADQGDQIEFRQSGAPFWAAQNSWRR